MDCIEVKGLFYDFLTERLDKEQLQEAREHLSSCRHCKENLKAMEGTLSLLDEWKTPGLSPGFRIGVMEAIEEREQKKPLAVMKRFFEKLLWPRYKIALEAVAVAMMVVLALTVYKNFVPQIEPIDKTPRGIEFSSGVAESKRPVLIETVDVEKASTQLLGMIESHRGKLVRRRPVEGGMEVTFKIEKEEEERFFKDLDRLGRIKREEGYKDGEGNIVVVLIRK